MSGAQAGGPRSHHHHSHRQLLRVVQADYAPHAPVDAIIVPAARPVESLRTAMDLASRLGCVLVVFCSRWLKAEEVSNAAGKENVSVVALDIDDVETLPGFETSAVVADARFVRPADQSRKRNLGLLLSRVAGWRRVLFLDDDIDDVHPSDVRAAAGLLSTYDIVCLENVGFADNSVVCRIGRQLGQQQDQFIGAGALAVAPSRMGTFFPEIYNEDWFFFLGTTRMAVTGSMRHRSLERSVDPRRAGQEELGDCLGEGMFWALDDGLSPANVDRGHWNRFLDHRRWFIEWLETVNQDGPRSSEVSEALAAAHEKCEGIANERDLCDGYIQLWRSDLSVWRKFVKSHPVNLGLVKAIAELGWTAVARVQLLPSHEEDRLIFPNGGKPTSADQQAARPIDRAAQSPRFAPPSGHGPARD